MAGKGTPATLLLAREAVPHVLHPYEPGVSGSYGEAGAAALGVEPARMLKTLLADLDGKLVCAVVPVGGSLDLKALAAALEGKKASMASPLRPSARPGTSSAGSARSGRRPACARSSMRPRSGSTRCT